MRIVTWLFVAAALIFCTSVQAQTYLTASVTSYHFDRSKKYNEDNPGIGVEHVVNDDWRLITGGYKNSLNKQSLYAGALWQPLHWGGLSAGAQLGIVSGYGHTAVIPLILPTLSYEWKGFGINVVAMPPVKKYTDAVIGLQLKWQLGS